MPSYQQGFFEGIMISLQAAKQTNDKTHLITYLENIKATIEGYMLAHIQKQVLV